MKITTNTQLKDHEEIIVKAWWNDERPVKCFVSGIPRSNETWIFVRPLEGNPHFRRVDVDQITDATGIIHLSPSE